MNVPDLSLLLRDLKEIQSVVSDHLARRAQRMVKMDFLEILPEITLDDTLRL